MSCCKELKQPESLWQETVFRQSSSSSGSRGLGNYSLWAAGPPSLVTFHLGMAPQSFEEMLRLTENLSEKYVAGRGGSSTVYKCTLKNGHSIAIKKLFNYYPQNIQEFETELKTLGNIKHRNIVSLRGYSMSTAGNFLFYDFMEYGSLYDHLHGTWELLSTYWQHLVGGG